MKMLGIVAMGVVRESRKFSGHPQAYIRCVTRSSLRQHSFVRGIGSCTFTARCIIVQSVVMSSHVVRMSVCDVGGSVII